MRLLPNAFASLWVLAFPVALTSCSPMNNPSAEVLRIQSELQARSDAVANEHLYRLVLVSLAMQDPIRFPQYIPVLLDRSNEVNAFCDGTAIHILQGMVRFLHDDHELAAVVGHELGHCTRGHVERRLERESRTLSTFAPLLGGRELERDEEREADRYGLLFLHQAGFDLEAGIVEFERKAAALPYTNRKEYLSTHPTSLERLAFAKDVVSKLRAGIDPTTDAPLAPPAADETAMPGWFDPARVFAQSRIVQWIAAGHRSFLTKQRKAVGRERARLNDLDRLSDRYASEMVVAEVEANVRTIEADTARREALVNRARTNAVQRAIREMSAGPAPIDPNSELINRLDARFGHLEGF